ncbi:UNVERIFIED_CONTAM: hypothetical protein Sradi_1895200 [Sesamum radiatum]|uniref:Secreted protein n=1 Tax=Sesamum radiatum TaxID=300843 RepID=A0AAW2TZC1_SESRA
MPLSCNDRGRILFLELIVLATHSDCTGKAYDDHIKDTVTSRTNSRYSHRVHVTAMIPQVRGLLLYCRSWGLESYRSSLQGFHMMVPAS